MIKMEMTKNVGYKKSMAAFFSFAIDHSPGLPEVWNGFTKYDRAHFKN